MAINRAAAGRAVKFFENLLVHTKGEYAGEPFKLYPWQKKKIIEPLFGTLRNDGTRQYRNFFGALPRKNGKSEIAAGVALYMLLMDSEPSAEVYGAASDREQAAIVFNVAKRMVELNPQLSKHCTIIDSKKTIYHPKSNSFYRAIPADAAGAHGFNASAVIVDEVHTQRNRELIDTLTTSSGTRRQPLIFSITTAGYDRQSICWEMWEYAQRVLKGEIDDPTLLPVIYAAGKDADWTSEQVWKRCNPALGDFRSLDEMREMCNKAQNIAGLQNTFRRLYLNQWTEQASRWLDVEKWDACAGELPDCTGLSGFAGLDLASTTDIAAFVAVIHAYDAWNIYPMFWIPEDAMTERSMRDGVPYDAWVREGFIRATPGSVIDYNFIENDIKAFCSTYNIGEIAFDRWGAMQLANDLQADSVATMIPFGQGFASMSPPSKELLNKILKKEIRHDGNPVLRWMVGNVAIKQDPAGNIKPDKGKSSEKIDGVVSLVMAIDRGIRNQNEQGSIYESRGFSLL